MGPPPADPSSCITLYFNDRRHSAYFSPIPNSAVIHIQNTAPGPPMAIAVPTPAIFPVPMVADNAALKAWKCVISPASSFLSNFPDISFHA